MGLKHRQHTGTSLAKLPKQEAGYSERNEQSSQQMTQQNQAHHP